MEGSWLFFAQHGRREVTVASKIAIFDELSYTNYTLSQRAYLLMTNLLEEVRLVIIDVIDDENIGEITETTTAQDIEGWDSLQHVRILIALERKFKFRFSNEEVEKLKNVGGLVAAVSGHIGAAT